MNDPGFSFGYKVQFSAPIVKPIKNRKQNLDLMQLWKMTRVWSGKNETDFDEATFTSVVQKEMLKLSNFSESRNGTCYLWKIRFVDCG